MDHDLLAGELRRSITVVAVLAIEFAGQFVGPLAIDRFGRKQRRNLLLLAQELRQDRFHGLGGNVFIREESVNLLLAVVRGGGSPEGNPRQVLFVVFLQRLCLARSGTDAYQQHARRQGIQRTGVTHLQVLFAEMLDSGILNLADHIGRCPAIGLVYREDDSFRVGIDAALQDHYAQGILLMRRS